MSYPDDSSRQQAPKRPEGISKHGGKWSGAASETFGKGGGGGQVGKTEEAKNQQIVYHRQIKGRQPTITGLCEREHQDGGEIYI